MLYLFPINIEDLSMEQVDRLAELRRQMKANRAEQKLIRQRLIAGLDPAIGRDYVADVRRHVTLKPIERAAEPVIRPSNGVREYYHAAD
jgi:hypothetical protein